MKWILVGWLLFVVSALFSSQPRGGRVTCLHLPAEFSFWWPVFVSCADRGWQAPLAAL
jgi:hypothetical protein